MKSYNHFTLSERECLQQSLAEGKSLRTIARELGKYPSTVSREYHRNCNKDGRYNAWGATVKYIVKRKESKRKNIIQKDTPLYNYVTEHLKQAWSPEQIAERGKMDGYQVCFSTIYRYIHRGLLDGISSKKHLRRRGKKKTPKDNKFNTIHPEHTIHERPAVIEEKSRFGDWEGDTVYGAVGKGCIVTLVDRKSKILAAAISQSREQNDIREAFKTAFEKSQADIPIYSITLDNGSEFAAFKEIEQDLNTTIYFADAHSPWQRGLNENTNDIIRFFFPKGTDFHKVTSEELDSVISLINNRPRKCLSYLSPLEFITKKCCT